MDSTLAISVSSIMLWNGLSLMIHVTFPVVNHEPGTVPEALSFLFISLLSVDNKD